MCATWLGEDALIDGRYEAVHSHGFIKRDLSIPFLEIDSYRVRCIHTSHLTFIIHMNLCSCLYGDFRTYMGFAPAISTRGIYKLANTLSRRVHDDPKGAETQLILKLVGLRWGFFPRKLSS